MAAHCHLKGPHSCSPLTPRTCCCCCCSTQHLHMCTQMQLPVGQPSAKQPIIPSPGLCIKVVGLACGECTAAAHPLPEPAASCCCCCCCCSAQHLHTCTQVQLPVNQPAAEQPVIPPHCLGIKVVGPAPARTVPHLQQQYMAQYTTIQYSTAQHSTVYYATKPTDQHETNGCSLC